MENENKISDEKPEQGPRPIKGGQTRDSIRKQIEGEIKEARIKEARGKIKSLVDELSKAKAVVSGKEDQIQALFEEYADVLPE